MGAYIAGIYLQTLREGLGLTRQGIARVLGTSYPQVARIEEGSTRVNAKQIADYTALVFGKPDDVFMLLRSETLTVADARRLAHERLADIHREKTPEDLAALRAKYRNNHP